MDVTSILWNSIGTEFLASSTAMASRWSKTAVMLFGSWRPDGQLIYSQHNIIYAYGPLDEFERLLIRRDFVMSDFEIPAPHVHYYHNQFDPVGRDILASAVWERFQLEDMDDET
jgi:hypothetical protein